MKQHTNNYYVRNIVKPMSQVSTNSAVTRSTEQKPISYLTFSRARHRRKNETAIKLPELLPSSVRAKTEMDQPIQSELKKSVVIISRKPSGVNLGQRVKTQPSIQVWEPEIQQMPQMTEESVITVQPRKPFNILCEDLMFNEKIDITKQKTRIQCITKINELEQFQDKSSRIVRKIIQLLKTNRERMEEKELKSRTMIDTQMVRSNLFLQAQTQFFPEQSAPSPREIVFQQQLSAIPKKHTKYNSQITLTHQPESLKPMKSLIEAIKEKQQEIIKQPIVNATTPAFPIKNKKKIKLTIECSEEQKQNKMEFYVPLYMEEDSLAQPNQQNDIIEIKDTKKSNIYSLVSKNMFNQKINQIQNLNDDILDEFNSDKATQFTRYYLQNYVLKGINQKKIKEKNDDERREQILKQDSKQEQQQFSSKLMDSSFLKDFQNTRFLDISSLIYRCPEPYDSQDSSFITDYSDCTNKSAFDHSCDYGMKLRFLLSVSLISPFVIREKLLKFLISTISDESKNTLLHQEIMDFANHLEEVIHIDYEVPHQPHLEALNRLFLRINKKERKGFVQRFFQKYELICIGVFEHQVKQIINSQEKQFIKYCFSQQNNSIMDNTSVKCFNMLKSKHQRETTQETISNKMNLMTLSLPPAATKSRSESPSNISEAKTQKNGSTQQHIPLRNTQRKPSQRFLQVQGQNKTQSQQLILKVQNLSVVKEKEIILQKDEVKEEIKKQKMLQQNTNYFKQLSMDPYSLLFRNMMIQKTKNEDKTLHEKVFALIEEHRLLDLKEIFKQETSIDINFQNEDGNTLLISASKCGAASIVDYLLKNGADAQLSNYDGQTAMDIALHNYQFETADIIYKHLKLDNKHL